VKCPARKTKEFSHNLKGNKLISVKNQVKSCCFDSGTERPTAIPEFDGWRSLSSKRRKMELDSESGSVVPAAEQEYLSPQELAKRINYKYPNLRLLTRALTHRSYVNEHPEVPEDNERLEFLGDRILNLIVAEYLFQTCPGPEGDLTVRMEWTKNRNIARVILTADIGFENLILAGSNQERTPRIIAGAFEAFVAALYLDLGLSRTKTIVHRILAADMKEHPPDKNYKKLLQEFLQKRSRPLPIYELRSTEGAPHKPRFYYVVTIEGTVIGKGFGTTKAQATQNAARQGLQALTR
jgi:ribonuclease-3